MSLPRYAARTAGFALLYLLATVAGMQTPSAGGVHLLWPAAAVGAIWLVAQSRFGRRGLDVVALSTAAALIPATEHTLIGTFALAAVQAVPAVLFAWLLARWLPGYWLGHGDRFRRTAPTITRLAAAAGTAAAAGAVLHSLGDFSPAGAGFLLVRDGTTVLLAVLATRALAVPRYRSGIEKRRHLRRA